MKRRISSCVRLLLETPACAKRGFRRQTPDAVRSPGNVFAHVVARAQSRPRRSRADPDTVNCYDGLSGARLPRIDPLGVSRTAARVLRGKLGTAVEQEPQQTRPPATRGDVRRGLAVAVHGADHAQLLQAGGDVLLGARRVVVDVVESPRAGDSRVARRSRAGRARWVVTGGRRRCCRWGTCARWD